MEKIVIKLAAWILLIFGLFCLFDGIAALLSGNPCWIIRIGFGPLSITAGGILVYLLSKTGGQNART